jgi:hypothetical protein
LFVTTVHHHGFRQRGVVIVSTRDRAGVSRDGVGLVTSEVGFHHRRMPGRSGRLNGDGVSRCAV